MSRTSDTQKGETPRKFGDRTEGFKDVATETAMHLRSVSIPGRARQALELLLQSEERGLTQRVTLALDPTFWRLAAAIGDLRDRGFLICTHRMPKANGGWYARYVLMGVDIWGGVQP